MHADARNLSTAPADLTPPGGPGLAPAEGGLPNAVTNGESSVLNIEDDLAGNGYTAAQTDSDDSDDRSARAV